MKVKLSALMLTLAITSVAAQADWLSAVKDSAGSALKETKDSAKTAALNATVRSALGLTEGQSTQTAIVAKLGEPASKSEKDGKTLWTYDINVLAQTYPTLTEIIKTQQVAQKAVQLSFHNDVLAKLELSN